MHFRFSACLAASVCLAAPAIAAPLDDPGHTITIQLENDSTRPGSDYYYTAGQRIAYTSPTGVLPGSIAELGHAWFGAGTQRFGAELSQQIFTPRLTKPNAVVP